MESAVGKVVVFEVALVALCQGLLAAARVAQFTVVETRYEQVPPFVLLSPLLRCLHLRTHSGIWRLAFGLEPTAFHVLVHRLDFLSLTFSLPNLLRFGCALSDRARLFVYHSSCMCVQSDFSPAPPATRCLAVLARRGQATHYSLTPLFQVT